MDSTHYLARGLSYTDIIECGISLLQQDFDQKPDAHSTGELQLYVNTEERYFFYADEQSMQTTRKIIRLRDAQPLESINLKQIKRWEKKQNRRKKQRKQK